MIERKVYSRNSLSWGMLDNKLHCLILFTLLLFPVQRIFAQEETVYDEIPVFLEFPRVGGFEISAVIMEEDLFLPITDLFDFLKIRNVPAPGLESISGFFISQEADFVISRTDNLIRYQEKTFNLEPGDLIRTEFNLYLRSTYFGKVFGLDCIFNFRSLSVKIVSKLELPLIREMRMEEMRRNLTRLKGEVKADTTVKRSYPLFRMGMADWSAIATQEIEGNTDTRLNLALGAMIAGGEATASLTYNSIDPFSEKQQYYLWRYVDNDFKAVRQVMAGKIATMSTSTIYNPVIGVQFTNTPTTYRRSFGSYTLSDRTEPNWIVELYVNNVLIDYIKADASGFFKFEVPLVYGNSIVQLKFFGPWGEERVREQNINIPFNFLPKNTFEYKVSAGLVEDSLFSRFSRVSLNYGVSRRLTVGSGIEYLSSVVSGPAMPYFNASWSILKNILLSGEYTYGVRSKGTLSYRLPSNIQLDLNYTRYDKDQKAISFNYREEKRATVSLPVKIRTFSSFQRISLYQIVLPASKYTTGEWMFTGSVFGVSTNLTTYALFLEGTNPYVYSNLSLSLRLPAKFILMPQTQYSYTHKEFLSAKLVVEKHLMENAFLNLSLEQNFSNNYRMAELGFRYNFSFAQTGLSVRQSNKRTSLVEYARGSLIYDKKTGYLGGDNQFNVGKGGISVIPFLDINTNGLRDPGEPKAYGLNLRANGGRIEKSERDTTIRILGLEPYSSCFIELDENSFENISWRLPIRTLSVAVDPNILKHIEIPVNVVGEASGSVTLDKKGEISGQGRIIMRFSGKNHKLSGTTLTEEDGYYSWFGLVPGNYTVAPDTSQLRKLGMVSEPQTIDFKVTAGLDGEIIDGLDFKLRMLITDTTGTEEPKVTVVTRKDSSYIIVHEVVQELITISKDSYAIQLGAFRNKANAEVLRRNLEKLLGRKVEIIIEDNFYKVRINEIETRKEVDEIISVLHKNGITELWVISLKAKQQQMILTEKQDSLLRVDEIKTFLPFGDEFYKLKLPGDPLLDPTILEMMEIKPGISKPVFSDIRHIRVQLNEELPAKENTESSIDSRQIITLGRVEAAFEFPSFAEHHFRTAILETKLEKPIIRPEPTISLQVAVYQKQSQALQAKRRITSKLKLPVEIVQQWEYYKVIITGFHTREETYKYYPELAGIGYPNITLIEE